MTFTTHDEMGRPRFIAKTILDVVKNKIIYLVTEKRYEKLGNETQSIQYHSPFTELQFDTIPDAIKNDPYNRMHRVLWGANHKPHYEIDAEGCVTELLYNKQGDCITRRTFADSYSIVNLGVLNDKDLCKELDTLVRDNARDQVHHYFYDQLRRKTHEVAPDLSVIRQVHDHCDSIESTIQFADKLKSYTDYQDLECQVNALVADAAKDRIKQCLFDAADRVSDETHENGRKDHYEYDPLNNMKKHIQDKDKAPKTWEFHHDRAKRLLSKISPKIMMTQVKKGEDGKLSSNTVETTITKSFEYHADGNVKKVIDGDGSDAKRVFELSEYDASGRLCQTQHDAVVDDKNKAKITSITDLPTKTVKVETIKKYDIRGRKIAEMDGDDKGDAFAYDEIGRLIYTVDKTGAVSKFTYNAFDEIVEIHQYDKPITFDLSQFIQTNGSSNLIKDIVKSGENDRTTRFEYDNKGEVTLIEQDEVFFHSNGQHGKAKPQTRKRYNAQGKCIYEAKLISPEYHLYGVLMSAVWGETHRWYDQAGRLIAEIDPKNYLTTYEYNAFGQISSRVEYANALTLLPDAKASMEAIKQLVIISKSKDRHYRYEYDMAGNQTAEIQKSITYHELVKRVNGAPSGMIEKTIPELVKWRKEYDAMSRLIKLTYPNGTYERFVYNDKGDLIAEIKPTRTYTDETGVSKTLTPIITYGVNEFGERVRTVKHKESNDLAEDQPFNLDIKQSDEDHEELVLNDNRGKPQFTQNAEKQVKGFTYTKSKKCARDFHETSTFKEATSDLNDMVRHIDGNKYEYDDNDREILHEIQRDGVVEERTCKKYNIFGELTHEGDSETNMPLFMDYDKSGNVWRTNSSGVTSVKLRDLAGHETVSLLSENDLTRLNYQSDDLEKLLDADPLVVDKTETIRDVDGNITATKAPYWHNLNWKGLPTHRYQYDRWRNVVHEQNSTGEPIDHEFNQLNQEEATTYQIVDVWNENGVNVIQRPVSRQYFDMNGNHIATLDGNKHLEAFYLDEIGQCYDHVLGDGTSKEKACYDIFNRKKMKWDATTNKPTTFDYTKLNQIKVMRLPSGLSQAYAYDGAGNRVKFKHQNGNTYHFDFDARRNLATRIEPDGKRTKMEYTRNNKMLKLTDPAGEVKVWQHNYFGVLQAYKLFGNELYHYKYDFKGNLKSEYSDIGMHGDEYDFDMVLDTKKYFGTKNANAFTTNTSVPEFRHAKYPANRRHHVEYKYKNSLLMRVEDLMSGHSIMRTYNSDGLCKTENSSDRSGTSRRSITADYDAMRREYHSVCSIVTESGNVSVFELEKKFDGTNNVRHRRVTLTPAGYDPAHPCPKKVYEGWFKFNAADYVTVCDGELVNNEIKLATHQGFGIYYKGTLRAVESVKVTGGESITSDIHFTDDKLLSETKPRGMLGVRTTRRRLANCTEYTEGSSKTLETWNQNFAIIYTQYWEDLSKPGQVKTDINMQDKSNRPASIHTADTTHKKVKQSDYHLSYMGLDEFQPATASGNFDDTYADAAMLYRNGLIHAKVNTADERRNEFSGPSWPVFFETLPTSEIIKKLHVFHGDYKGPSAGYEIMANNRDVYAINMPSTMRYMDAHYFFHSINHGLTGFYGERLNSVDMFKNAFMGQTGGFNDSQYAYPKLDEHGLFVMTPIRPVSKTAKANRSTTCDPYDLDKAPYPALSPRPYVVQPGDTFLSIARAQYGDEDAAEEIADQNGYDYLLRQRLVPETVLFLPEHITSRYKANTNRSYSEFIGVISGSIAPFFAIKPPHIKKTPFWKKLVRVIAVALAIIAAPFLVTALTGLIAGPLFAMLTGITTAFTEATAQGLMVGIGAQEHFSLAEALESGLSAGLMAGPLTAVANATNGVDTALALVEVGAAAVSAQLIAMEAGWTKHFDAGAVITQIAASLIGKGIDKAIPTNTSQRFDAAKTATNNTAKSLANSALGLATHRTPINAENLAADIMGNTLAQGITKKPIEKLSAYLQEREARAQSAAPERRATQARPKAERVQTTHNDPVHDPAIMAADADAHYQLPKPELDLRVNTINQAQQQYRAVQAAQASSLIHDKTDIILDFASKITKGTIVGAGLDYVRTERMNARILAYGSSAERLEAVEHFGVEVAVAGVGGVAGGLAVRAAPAVPSLTSRLVSRFGMFGRGGAEGGWQVAEKALETMEGTQAKNLKRFVDKLPQNSENIRVRNFLDGGKVFQADSPASNIPGSFARYEKQIDASGNTVLYTKTTFGPNGEIVHVAPKFPTGPKIYPDFDVRIHPGLDRR